MISSSFLSHFFSFSAARISTNLNPPCCCFLTHDAHSHLSSAVPHAGEINEMEQQQNGQKKNQEKEKIHTAL